MCGALKRARLVHPGVAEVVFVKKDDAVTAYKKYNNRCLDGTSDTRPVDQKRPDRHLWGPLRVIWVSLGPWLFTQP